MMRIISFLVPRIAWRDVPWMFGVAAVGAVMTGVYGVLHDQVTYSISPEYFTNHKFKQFHYANLGWGDQWFVAAIGFLATWWVGFIIAWFLARRLVPDQPRRVAIRQLAAAFGCVFLVGAGCGVIGWAYGQWRGPDADYSAWYWAIIQFQITDTWAFVKVAYIHNASYLGGALGLIAALLLVRPNPIAKTQDNQNP